MGPVQTLLPMNSVIPERQPCAVLDIKNCFFSIPLHKEDKERFAFSVVFPNSQRPNLRFQWKMLPQRMINSPTICQITVDQVLAPVRCSDPTVTIIQYMDDILIATPSGSQVDHLVSAVSETLKTNEFEIASAKVKRGPCVTFLGVRITGSYVTPPPNENPSEHQNAPRYCLYPSRNHDAPVRPFKKKEPMKTTNSDDRSNELS